ncbi:unnamed protein product, partial [Rotaria magnacalcarata]
MYAMQTVNLQRFVVQMFNQLLREPKEKVKRQKIRLVPKKKKTQSTSKTKRIITVIDHYTSTDVDDDNDAHSTPIRVQPNLIHLSDSLASD